jgi:hypothetical protein
MIMSATRWPLRCIREHSSWMRSSSVVGSI